MCPAASQPIDFAFQSERTLTTVDQRFSDGIKRASLLGFYRHGTTTVIQSIVSCTVSAPAVCVRDLGFRQPQRKK